MGMNLNAQQSCVVFGGESRTGGGASLVTNGSGFAISNSDTLYSGKALCGVSYLHFSSPELSDGDHCTLSSGDSDTTAQAQSGTVSSGRGGMGGGKFGGGRPDSQPGQGMDDGQPGQNSESSQPSRSNGGGKQKPDGSDFLGRPDDQPQANGGNSV